MVALMMARESGRACNPQRPQFDAESDDFFDSMMSSFVLRHKSVVKQGVGQGGAAGKYDGEGDSETAPPW
jgi:hypothetical protein